MKLALKVSALCALLACSDDTTEGKASGLQCDAERGVSAGGKQLVPCSQLTGLASSETSLAVLKNGDILVAPVITPDGTGILRSQDRAASWETLLPGKLGGAAHNRVQPYMYVEPVSERVLFATTTGAASTGFDLSLSDDGGSSWRRGPQLGVGTADWIKIVSGPSGLYASSPAPISTAFADHQQVLHSSDGGQTWKRIDNGQLPLKPTDNGCPDSEWVIYGGGVVAPDGALYLGLRRCTHLAIASTRDQVSWTVRDLPEANLVAYGGLLSHFDLFNLMAAEPLAVDSDGNLYAIWNDQNDALKLAISRDRAETWSKPVLVNPAAVARTVFADIAVQSAGVIALGYYGSEDNGGSYHAYVSESLDALATAPTFAAVRLTSEPMFSEGFDLGYSELITMGDLMETFRVAYAPNGDIWSSFAKDMCPGMDRSHCSWLPEEHANATYQLVIGRVEHR